MRWLACFLLGACLSCPCMAAPVADTQHVPWLPITPQDLQVKEVPGIPGAPAIQLYYADEIDDIEHTEVFYTRIKVLAEQGKSHADVEIPIFPGTSIHDLEARTIHPDGSIVDFAGNSFEKTLFKSKGIKILAKTFTLPEVTVGSIVEYKYRLRRDDKSMPDQTWIVQHDLFTVKEHFWFNYDHRGGRTVAWVTTPGLKQSPEQKPGAFEMQAENIPPFEKEELMPPESSYKLAIKFFYGGTEMVSSSVYWSRYGSLLSDFFQKYIGEHKEIRKAAEEVVGAETDQEKRLRKLYAKAQEIRNLSYERDRDSQEKKKEQLKKNENVADVLKHGYGDHDDVTTLFVAMARAAGYDASIVMVSSRQSRLFDRDVLSLTQLDGLIARVAIGGKPLYLDPGTRFCPFGFVRWMRTGTAAMDMKHPGDLFQLPGASQEAAVTTRAASFALDAEGNLKGTITMTFTGGEALEHRLSALDTDETGRSKDLEQELKDGLPANAVVKLTDSKAWNNEGEPLIAVFAVELPAYASVMGKRLLLPAGLFQPKKSQTFLGAARKYPIYFPYAFTEKDQVVIQIPDGYSAESLPARQEVRLPYARYVNASQITDKQLQIERSILFNAIFLQATHYAELKDFFAKMHSGDEAQTVLQKTPAEAHKTN